MNGKVSFSLENDAPVGENSALLDLGNHNTEIEPNGKIRSISQALEKQESQEEETMECFPPNRMCLEWGKQVTPAFVVLTFILMEKFAFNGIQTLFTFYLNLDQGFTEDLSKIQYHIMFAICYLATVIFAGVADAGYGKLKVILCISVVYFVGIALLLVSAVLDPNRALIVFASGTLAIGSGGVKACLSTFAIEQLKTKNSDGSLQDPSQRVIEMFFALIHMGVNFAGLLANISLPVLRSELKCKILATRQGDDCYVLAFGVAGAVFLVGTVLFASFYKFYHPEPPSNGLLIKSMKAILNKSCCICTKNNANVQQTNTTDPQFMNMLTRTLKLTRIFLTFPVFWALYEQQASSWIFQANKMDGRIDSQFRYTIKPEQMLVINVLCCVIAIPAVNAFLYPVLAKCGFLEKLETRIVFGYFLAAASFLCAGSLQIVIDRNLEKGLPQQMEAEVFFFWMGDSSTRNCTYDYTITAHARGKSSRRYSISGSVNSQSDDKMIEPLGNYSVS
ncbi:hypothetical protein Ciccas_008208 [Cichlidogyrus casuarinus]|uniref:Solute carrier family 15 member 1 n=1 Tax=Cichlidogyrus casuarinus TaxID=1844966 RepID=A0ABD2Q1V1_9PLAT